MAQRTIEEIKQSIIDRQPSKFPELSSSNVAEWDLWIDVVAYAIWLFEGILSIFQSDSEDRLKTKKPGNLIWLRDIAYDFQFGYSLTVDESGIMSYPVIDESAKIIKRVSINEDVDANGKTILSLKVAKFDDQGVLTPLATDNGELIEFQRYITNLKYAGTKPDIVSLAADSIKYVVDVYFDPVKLEATVQANILAALEEYKVNLNFNGIVYRSDILNTILKADGVVTAKITTLDHTHATTTSIDVKKLLVSGYFNFDETSVLNLIDNNEA